VLAAVGFVEDSSSGELLGLPAGRLVELPTLLALGRLDRCAKGVDGIARPGENPSDGAGGSERGDDCSHRCASCAAGIRNDVRAAHRASGGVSGWRSHEWNAAGEYRFSCTRCARDLCARCYDRWKTGDASVHALDHAFEIVAPITTAWGGRGYGPPPAAPSLSARPRRGPFG